MDLGYHRDRPLHPNHEVYRRIWWISYVWDKLIGIERGYSSFLLMNLADTEGRRGQALAPPPGRLGHQADLGGFGKQPFSSVTELGADHLRSARGMGSRLRHLQPRARAGTGTCSVELQFALSRRSPDGEANGPPTPVSVHPDSGSGRFGHGHHLRAMGRDARAPPPNKRRRHFFKLDSADNTFADALVLLTSCRSSVISSPCAPSAAPHYSTCPSPPRRSAQDEPLTTTRA